MVQRSSSKYKPVGIILFSLLAAGCIDPPESYTLPGVDKDMSNPTI